MAVIDPHKSDIQFQKTVDMTLAELESFLDVVIDFDRELEQPIEIFKALLECEPSKDNCYAIAQLVDYFFNFKNQFISIKKVINSNYWKLEPYFEKYSGYKHEDFLIAQTDLEEEVLRYEKILDKHIKRGVSYLKANDSNFSL